MGVLDGIRVLDLSRILSGPYLTMCLGDMGAEVIKVEEPGKGDDTRRWGPPFVGDDSAYYLSINRNKRAIALNLKLPEGRNLALRLAKSCDVVVENFRAGAIERLGLGYDVLSALARRLVMVRVSAYGERGPSRELPGYDLLAQAVGGLMSVTGEAGRPPAKAGFAIADLGAALFALSGVLAALYARERTGRGAYLTTSLYETQLALHVNLAQNYFTDGRVPVPLGSAHPNLAPYQAFAASDGDLVVAVGNDAMFARLAGALGKPELAADPRFASNADRVRHREELAAVMQSILGAGPLERWLQVFEFAGVPAGPIRTIAGVYADPQTQALGIVQTIGHPIAGALKQVGFPVQFDGMAAELRRPPPLFGEHTREILAELGLDARRVAQLESAGVVEGPVVRAS